LARSAGAAKEPAAALVGNDAALFSLRRTAFASSRTPGGGFQHLAGSIERKRRGAIIILTNSRIAGKSGGTAPAERRRFPRSGATNRPDQRIFPILAALHALAVKPGVAASTGSRRARINGAIAAKIFIADKLASPLIANKALTAWIHKLVKPATAPANSNGTTPTTEIYFPDAIAANRAGNVIFADLSGGNAFAHIHGAVAPAAGAGIATDSVAAIPRTALPIAGAGGQIALIGKNIVTEKYRRQKDRRQI